MHEWNAGKAVTFIVTLAATRSVTFAAHSAGMSRKAAYALKSRDQAFADAWNAAVSVRRSAFQGDEVEQMEHPPVPCTQGNRRLAPTVSPCLDRLAADASRRDRFFAHLRSLSPDSRPLARRSHAE